MITLICLSTCFGLWHVEGRNRLQIPARDCNRNQACFCVDWHCGCQFRVGNNLKHGWFVAEHYGARPEQMATENLDFGADCGPVIRQRLHKWCQVHREPEHDTAGSAVKTNGVVDDAASVGGAVEIAIRGLQ